MPVYEYKALDKKGKRIKGTLDAESQSQAGNQLRRQGVYPVSIIRTHQRQKKNKGHLSWRQGVRPEEISVWTRQLATLLAAGIPLVQALDSLYEQTVNKVLKNIVADVRDAVNEGSSLTDALAPYPRLFSSVYVNMVRAGEASGSLDIVLERLADFAEKQEAIRARLRAALVYPVFMAVIGTAILFVLVTYIVPNITQVFVEMDRVLPLPTLLLIQCSDFLQKNWWFIALALAAFVITVRMAVQKPWGRRIWDYIKLKFVVIGPVMQKVILVRFASTLGSLLKSGVGLMDSMAIVRAVVANVHIAEVVGQSMEQVRKGQSVVRTLQDSEWFPPVFVQMIGVGEQSGTLDKMLEKSARAYEREVEMAVLAMTSLIEPVMIAVMGLVIGFIVLSILLPIFEMNQMLA